MSQLAEILSSRARAEIFRLLFGLNSGELHMREIERRSGLSIGAVQRELRKLLRLDLVSARKDGNRTYYQPNERHPLFPDIRNLVLKTSGLVDVLRESLGDLDISAALVFGSIGRGEEDGQSDVDLMVIGNTGLRKLSEALSGVPERIGREVNPHALSPAEFRRRLRRGDHLATRAMESPKLFVIGTGHELAAMGE